MTAFSCAMLLNRPCIVLKSSHCSIKLFMIGVFEIRGVVLGTHLFSKIHDLTRTSYNNA
ncbi:hypothetical protein KVC79_00650 [Helicobacter pylori]|nr:hypothetical protein KVC79_00650 [Helicobacter pylori]